MPDKNSFIHLRVHSSYSLAEGAIKVVEDKPKDGQENPRTDLIHLCLEQNMPAVALTDKGNLFGALEFAMAAAEHGIQPIMGCQIAVLRPGQDKAKPMAREEYDQILLLVQNEVGWLNLSALVSHSFLAQDRPFHFVTMEEVREKSSGLIAISCGIEGAVGRLLLDGQKTAAQEMLLSLEGIFKNRFYIELNRHQGGIIGDKEARIEADMIQFALTHNIPMVATNDVYFGEEAMFEAHDALICISEKTLVAEENRRRMTPDHYFKSADQMRELFKDVPEACDNTAVIARRCAFMPREHKPILPPFATEGGRSEKEELTLQAKAGLKARIEKLKITDIADYEKRLDFELNVIMDMGFAGYFLIVSDFIKWAKSQNIAVGPGRGSGAGSVVAWALLITDLDPIKLGLLFERFLNPERVSMPDFDIDFCQERRDEVIGYVQQKYGADKVAQIITYGKLQARAVLRDVGRVLAIPYGYVDKICKLIPNNPAAPVGLKQAVEMEPQLKQLRDTDPMVAQMMDMALKLEGLYRNASTHAAGVVIGDRPLVELAPLYRDTGATMPATQFNLKMIEAAGLVKFDFLGLKTLDVLQQAEAMVRARGIDIDLLNLPENDAKTYALLARGDTVGIFQFESSGMRDVLRRLKPNRFEDIIAIGALYRPGPMDNIPDFIAIKNGVKKLEYLHPKLQPILEDTCGIIVYQEQVMLAAQILAGYSLGGADLLRRAMGKKKASEMAAQRKNFIEGAARHSDIDADMANHIFDQIDKFAGYGFNKSHAAAYALITYQTAYLKANYPMEFFAAAMNFEMGDTDKLNIFRQELARQGIRLLRPDINHSHPLFTVEMVDGSRAIRYALAAIKGVGLTAMKALVEAREKSGAFKDIFDFAERTPSQAMNKKQLESLIAAGAFDSFNNNRAQMMAAVEVLLKHSHQATAERASGQVNMFGDSKSATPTLPQAKNWDELTKLKAEFEALGFYLSAHPLDNYRGILGRLGVVSSIDAGASKRVLGPSRVKLAGIVVSKQERTAKSGNKFAFVQLSDSRGAFEITIFSELLASRRDILNPGQALLIEADKSADARNAGQEGGDALRFIARTIEDLKTVAARSAQGISIRVYGADVFQDVERILKPVAGKGKGRVQVTIDTDDGQEVELELPGTWQLNESIKDSLRALGGIEVAEY